MIRRAWILPFHDDETPGGYCSRLAAWNGCTGARDFCLDMGLSYSRIVDGEDDALKGLSAITGVGIDALRANSFVKMGPRLFEVRGEIEIAAHSRRNYIRVCPKCIAEDITANPHVGPAAPFQRVHWQLSWVRSCFVHGLALRVAEEGKTAASLDFSNSVKPLLTAVASAGLDMNPTSGLERYLVDRLYGESGTAMDVLWLTQLPLYKAVRLCEVLGSVSLFGPNAAIKGLDDAAVATLGAEGFDLLRSGPDAVGEMLSGLMKAFWETNGRVGGGKLFGLLHSWLQDTLNDLDLDPVRKFVRSAMQSNLPVDPFITIYREKIVDQKIFSISSAARDLNIPEHALRNYLKSVNLIHEKEHGTSNEKIVFHVEEIQTHVDSLRQVLSSRAAAKYLGMSIDVFSKLVDMKIISPSISGWKKNSSKYFFFKGTLDEFQSRLMSGVTANGRVSGMLGIRIAGLSMSGGAAAVIKLILDGKLQHIVAKENCSGYASILVDPNEVKEKGNDEKEKITLSAREAARYMRWGAATVFSLISRGYLPHEVIPCKIRGKAYRIKIEDLENFDKDYISLTGACKKLGYSYVRSIINANNLSPAIEAKFGSAEFYLREYFI